MGFSLDSIKWPTVKSSAFYNIDLLSKDTSTIIGHSVILVKGHMNANVSCDTDPLSKITHQRFYSSRGMAKYRDLHNNNTGFPPIISGKIQDHFQILFIPKAQIPCLNYAAKLI